MVRQLALTPSDLWPNLYSLELSFLVSWHSCHSNTKLTSDAITRQSSSQIISVKYNTTEYFYCVLINELIRHFTYFPTRRSFFFQFSFSFYRAMHTTLASAVLTVVNLCVLLSHACFVTKPNNVLRIFWYQKGNHSSFLTPTVVGGRRPFQLKFQIWSRNDPSVSKNFPL